MNEGFQIWINVPSARKMDEPRYGTEDKDAIPEHEAAPGVMARLMAGPLRGREGAMKTQCATQMVDFELAAGARVEHVVPPGMDTAMLYVYKGSGLVAGERAPEGSVVLLDATDDEARGFAFEAGAAGAHALLFAGTKLKEPIAWHGPIVMNTDAQLHQCFAELRSGRFPPTRVDWDYKRIATKPSE